MKSPKKPGWWDEFVAFAVKGNAMALAVGTIIGAAFSTITKSLTDDVIMPIIANFISAVINFAILALVVFFLVKALNKMAEIGKKKEAEAPAEEPAPPAPSAEEVLLTEIRDLLKNK